MLRKLILFTVFLCLVGALVGGGFLFWGYYYITRDLPQLSTIEDYKPAAVSKVYANDGTLIAEFFHDERRYPVKFKDVPAMVRNCFIAAEDASFYQHKGIDPQSIIRAFVKNLQTGSAKQGGSTITQQVVKNLLLTSEKKVTRKIKEAILSYRLEERFSKDEILEIYLNQIPFGNSAYGIKAAAWVYFQKQLDQLTLGEAALLAGLPKGPSKYSPIKNMKAAKRRQGYVLSQMVKAGFAKKEDADAAVNQEVVLNLAGPQNIYHAPYYVREVRTILGERWKDYNPDIDGLEIYTAVDLKAEAMAIKGLRKGLKEIDKRRGWRGPIKTMPTADIAQFNKEYVDSLPTEIEPGEAYPALVTYVSPVRGSARVSFGDFSGSVDLKAAQWARRRLDREDHVTSIQVENSVKVGDVIEVSVEPPADTPTKGKENEKEPVKEEDVEKNKAQLTLVLDQTPEIEGATVMLDPSSGKVNAIVGGYSYQRSVFNRATQSLRQPGSTFKPIVYLTAIDGYRYTPATIVYDTPRTFRIGDQVWTPGNFDEKYLGGITLRTALEKSRNLVSVDIISRIGVDPVIQYAKKLGITTKLGRNLSLSLGSSELTLMELTRAYGVFAAKGVLFDSVLVTKIVDRNGTVVYDYETEKLTNAKQAISENSAFIMANMMKGVIEHGTGYKVKAIGRPVAGKTGTSNDQMDAWFIGYTPDWVCGVWTGFDVKKEIGAKETGGAVAAPIWLYIMKDFLAYEDKLKYERLVEESKQEAERLGIEYVPPDPLEPLDFSVPDGVDPFWVDKQTGLLSSPGSSGAIYEYFIKGTEPQRASPDEEDTSSYLESPDL